jgi:putrescine transport system permease protein
VIANRRVSLFRLAALLLGFAFLYLPIVLLVVYSFNASRLVTVWGGWSTRWYTALLDNEKYRDAALTSLEIAVMAATVALLLGTCAGLR